MFSDYLISFFWKTLEMVQQTSALFKKKQVHEKFIRIINSNGMILPG